MLQSQLDRAVAEATGESLDTIAHLGFVPLTDAPFESDSEREPLVVDWDELDRRRHWLANC